MTDRVTRETGEPGWPNLKLLNDETGEVVQQLPELARPFPDNLIERIEGNSYVAHHIINQRLLSIVGPFDFKLVELVRGDVAAIVADPAARSRRAKEGRPALAGVVVAAVYRLVCEVDGRHTEVEEIGECGDPHNWSHDGARLKDAASDALKRCAMRLGLGLHLWAQEHYFLDRQLKAQASRTNPGPEEQSMSNFDRLSGRGQQRPSAGLGGPAEPAWQKDGRQ